MEMYISNSHCEHTAYTEKRCGGANIEFTTNDMRIIAMRNQFNIISSSIGQDSRCQWDEYICISDSSCINRNLTCNGRNDCFDGSDEISCPFTGMKITHMDLAYFMSVSYTHLRAHETPEHLVC